MKLNYTARTILEIGSYTFGFSIVIFTLLWFIFDVSSALKSENQETVFAQNLESYLQKPQDNKHIKTFLVAQKAPKELQQFATLGFHSLNDNRQLFIGINPTDGQRFYILSTEASSKFSLINTELHDLALFTIGLIFTTLFSMWLINKMAKRIAAPILHLRRQVEQVTEASHKIPVIDRDDELGELSQSLRLLVERMHLFIAREKDFTRFASHELRSPITVIQGNLDLLESTVDSSELQQRVSTRMRTATYRMSMIIESFLWLSREENNKAVSPLETLNRPQILLILEELQLGFSDSDWQRLAIDIKEVNWRIRPAMLTLLVDNLIRNALRHSHQNISIVMTHEMFCIENPLENVVQDSNSGIGLKIIRHLCNANDWQLDIAKHDKLFKVSVLIHPKKTKPS